MIDDETIQKEKYRCSFASGVTIGDLLFKSTNSAHHRRVTLQHGDYILTELLDFSDLKKSRLTGSLSKFIQMGWIIVENPGEIVVERVETVRPSRAIASSAITEIQAGIIHAKDISNKISSASASSEYATSNLGYPKETHPKTVEALSLDKSRTINGLAISETEAQQSLAPSTTSYDKFVTLRYFQKLKTIKETLDQELLSLIIAKSSYPQLVHNSKNRLRELTTGR